MEVDEIPPHGEDFHAPAVGSLLVIHKPRDAREFIPELFKKRWEILDLGEMMGQYGKFITLWLCQNSY
jgi:hypothetical protein